MENAWLSLFRFIEFWMGIPYINPTEIYSSLERITEDLRLPGGQIDTEYVATPSSRRAQNVMENDT